MEQKHIIMKYTLCYSYRVYYYNQYFNQKNSLNKVLIHGKYQVPTGAQECHPRFVCEEKAPQCRNK